MLLSLFTLSYYITISFSLSLSLSLSLSPSRLLFRSLLLSKQIQILLTLHITWYLPMLTLTLYTPPLHSPSQSSTKLIKDVQQEGRKSCELLNLNRDPPFFKFDLNLLQNNRHHLSERMSNHQITCSYFYTHSPSLSPFLVAFTIGVTKVWEHQPIGYFKKVSFIKMGQPRPLFRLFSVFQTNNTILFKNGPFPASFFFIFVFSIHS